jgi:hypothetical protein
VIVSESTGHLQMSGPPAALHPANSAQFLQNLGFLLTPDMPSQSACLPTYLLVAMRPRPTLLHFDPERVDYWVDADGRGIPASLDRHARLPYDGRFAWGLMSVVDRLEVSNEYLSFGGHLSAAAVDGVVVAVFASPAPILCRGGHSQSWDPDAQSLAAFFARLRAAVGASRELEARLATVRPMTLYAAWIVDSATRYRATELLRTMHPSTFESFERQERTLRACQTADWVAALDLETVLREFVESPS